jgi:hypothetical protein
VAYDLKRDKKPHITNELLNYLAYMYPDRCPDPTWAMERIMYQAGAASVVRHLKLLIQEQEDNILRN